MQSHSACISVEGREQTKGGDGGGTAFSSSLAEYKYFSIDTCAADSFFLCVCLNKESIPSAADRYPGSILVC